MHYLDANKTTGEEARRQLHKNVASNIEQITYIIKKDLMSCIIKKSSEFTALLYKS